MVIAHRPPATGTAVPGSVRAAHDRARAEQLLARDARKAAKKAARGGDSKRSAAFKRRIGSEASAGRGCGGRGGRGRGRGR